MNARHLVLSVSGAAVGAGSVRDTNVVPHQATDFVRPTAVMVELGMGEEPDRQPDHPAESA
jgi:hypothetical protein